MACQEYTVSLAISADAYQRMYSGQARDILARDSQGRKIRFPAVSLRPFVTHEGINGVFIIRVDDNNKLVDVRRKQD
jgi:hypothetical protein